MFTEMSPLTQLSGGETTPTLVNHTLYYALNQGGAQTSLVSGSALTVGKTYTLRVQEYRNGFSSNPLVFNGLTVLDTLDVEYRIDNPDEYLWGRTLSVRIDSASWNVSYSGGTKFIANLEFYE